MSNVIAQKITQNIGIAWQALKLIAKRIKNAVQGKPTPTD
jgi:hypothetical protein